MSDMQIVDIFDVVCQEQADVHLPLLSADEALIEVLNLKNAVDIVWMANKCGCSVSKLISELEGVIYQQPEAFGETDGYDETVGWVLSARYLSGNVRRKFENAKLANEKYPGKFQRNLDALKGILPARVDIDDIHLSIGATWVPEKEISWFVAKLLNLKLLPEVVFFPDLKYYKIVRNDEMKTSILNTITYGVREEKLENGFKYVKQYLTAIDIIEDILNAKTIKVYDYVPKKNGYRFDYEYEPIFNKNKTVEAQNKQKVILDAFKDYVYENKARIARFESYYNDKMVGYTYAAYNGDFLKLRDLNPSVHLYKHQRDAVARVLLSGNNVLFSHDVGAGKTYAFVVSVHEMYRMGISKKNLIVVPNNVLKATVDAHRTLYKDDKILVVYPRGFEPKKRKRVLEEIAYGDYTAIYMAYSSFDMIVMSKQYYIDKYTKEIRKLRDAAYNAKATYEKQALERQEQALSKKLAKYIAEEKPCPWLTYDALGIQTLVVDEAHNYKNIPVATRAEGVVGLNRSSSKKCREMLEKAHYTERLIFATGTPLTNSLADLFAFQTYLQKGLLEYHNIDTFDTWINTFGQRETLVECDVDANSANLRTMTRFTSFHNLAELMSLFAQVCDFYHMSKDEEGLPLFNGHIDVRVPKNALQHAYIKSLSERTESIRNKEVDRTEDNLLKVTIDGRKAALDIRLVGECFEDYNDRSNKVNVCAKNVAAIYLQYTSSVQIVFSDIGTPKASFNVYDALSEALIANGVRKSEIAYVHDATTDTARAELFEAMNKGTIRVVIGSTQKLGVGVNVQEKLVAIHHLSVPWRPADMVQREGRILRKGNTSEEVFIYRYVTEGSFDAYSWQLLENKQRFISSFLSGTSAAREMEDIADTVLSYAEVKALAIGNPLIKKRVELSNQLERVKIACRSRQKALQQLHAVAESLPADVCRYKAIAKTAEADYAEFTDAKIGLPNEERIAFGEELTEALGTNVGHVSERLFGDYRGFGIYLPANMDWEDRYVLVKSGNGGVYRCDMNGDKTPVGMTKSIDYILSHLREYARVHYRKAEHAEAQMAEALRDIEKGNPFLREVESMAKELVQIDADLEEFSERAAG